MMGIAFIGAVVGGVDRIASGASSPDELRERVFQQLNKKFGSKGAHIVQSNMAVIIDGLSALQLVPYESSAYLAIDDEPVLRRVLASMLESLGYEVVQADGGRAGLAHLTGATAFDAVLCDLMMPDVDGVAVHAELAARRRCPARSGPRRRAR